MKHYAAFCAALVLAGCSVTPDKNNDKPVIDNGSEVTTVATDCVFNDTKGVVATHCDMAFWLDYWARIDQLSWPERESMIDQLPDEPVSLLQKILLSQPVNTPYKARLRAQHWFEQLLPSLSMKSQQRLNAVIFKPSEHMLEFESAVTLLSKVNNGQDKTIKAQEQQISELKAQLEALLNIESNLMNQEEETQQ